MNYQTDFDSILRWIGSLCRSYEVIAPKKETNGDIFYSVIESSDEVCLDFSGTPINTPKDFIYENYKTLLRWDLAGDKAVIEAPEEEPKKRIIFLRNCDIKAIRLLDGWFEKDIADEDYKKLRENLILVTIGCHTIGPFCFCSTFGVDPIEKENYTLQLIKTETGYILQAKDPGLTLPQRLEAVSYRPKELKTEILDLGCSNNIADFEQNAQIYDEITKRCQLCDGCTFLCPTCTCYDIADHGDETKGERVRLWDSCLFSSFTKMAKGYDPEPTFAHAWSRRLSCKLVMSDRSCIGCGRCDMTCPAGIGMKSILMLTQHKERK
ncbi:MAG: 4Fe-4S dicluster domain-containing protein [Sulfurovum sp.]|nr:4Fe-4S dicluster domain-containing protein [Sulfurovum sp.]MDD3603116.1 4Fe-4S dicluster domain-containing protein [Sulfurovum sp.]